MDLKSENSSRTRAKLIVSDFHLGEGRRTWDGSLNLLEDFTVDSKFVEFVDFYSKAFDEVELVLNGNFLEMLRCRAAVDYPDIHFETYAVEIINTIFDGHPEVMNALKRFMENPHHSLIYIMGEADIGVIWPKVQDLLKFRISERIQFFPQSYFDRGVYIEHGHQYESIYSMDLVNPFSEIEGLSVLKLPWGAFFNAHFVQPLRALRPQFYRVRPMKNYLVWSFLFETFFFFRVIWQFIKVLSFASSRKLYPGNSFWTVFQTFQSADTELLENKAEQILLEDGIQKVIFGHSHIADYRQYHNGKEYFNTGTWTRNLSLDLRSLGAFHRLTYVLVEYKTVGEPQAKLMEWFGRYEVIEDYL